MSPGPRDVVIESASLDDIDTLVDLWVALARGQRTYDSHLAAEGNRTPVRAALAHHVVADGVRTARADDGERAGDIVGFVMFGLEDGDYEQTVTRGVIHNLFVLPARRGVGVGGALLAHAERALADAGADVFSLEAMATNDGARRFYERRGYRVHRVELEKSARSDTHSKEDG
jgi:ribosomal protein S18 acetylase RimI-like enzyme